MTGFRPQKKLLGPQEIDHAIALMKAAAAEKHIEVALTGGAAMRAYGSDRLTEDVDFVGSETLGNQKTFEIVEPITFGGLSYKDPNGVGVDLIVRKDAYKGLYDEALQNATTTPEGTPIVTAEYLAVMKFAAGREKDLLDLTYLVTTPGVVDVSKAELLAERHLGGQFAKKAWRDRVDYIQWKAKRDRENPA